MAATVASSLQMVAAVSSLEPFRRKFTSPAVMFNKFVNKAMSESSENKHASGLPVELKGKRAFVADKADDNGYGWATAKTLAAAGVEILVGTWMHIKANKRYA